MAENKKRLHIVKWAMIRDSDHCSRHAGASGLVRIIQVWYASWQYPHSRTDMARTSHGGLSAGYIDIFSYAHMIYRDRGQKIAIIVINGELM